MNGVNHDLRAIFIRVPKTGSKSVAEALKPWFNPYVAGIGHVPISDHPERDRYVSMAFCRNPYDRFLSAYCWRRIARANKEKDLITATFDPTDWTGSVDRFLDGIFSPLVGDADWRAKIFRDDEAFWPQSHYLTIRGEIRVTWIGRFETLDRDYARICEAFDVPVAALPHHNASDHPPWEQVLSPAARAFVQKMYADDFRLIEALPTETPPCPRSNPRTSPTANGT